MSIRPLLPLVLLVLLPACRANGSAKPPGDPEPFVPLPDEEPDSIGYFLTKFDTSLARWSELKLTASSARDQNALTALETNMQERARKQQNELLATLESGSPVNRRVAAAALGFTHDPSVLGPLVAALSDRDTELVQKVLLALGVLALPETPLAGVHARLVGDPDAWTRNNAAFALLSFARAGLASPELAESCRAGLADTEPGVRAQCASALGVQADTAAVPLLAERLSDDENLVALASAAALARIGRKNLEQKGTVARALASALDEVKPDRRIHLLGALRWLADGDLGEDAQAWLEWAHKLP